MHRFNGRPAIILLVEDDPADQELMRRAFAEGRIRNELRIVGDGEEALDYVYRRGKYEAPASSPRPDLILVDLNMPKLDGRQVIRELRGDPGMRRVPVVVLTTSNRDEDVVGSYDLGANSFITKPVDAEEFMRVVRTLERYWFQIVVLPPGED